MPRVLIIEDTAPMARLIELQLKEAGVESDVAPTLADARAKLAVSHFDLVTLDIHLPDGDGFEFCRELKSRRKVVAPIIILTTEVSAESVVKGLECGAVDYLRKPIDHAELKARLRGHLRAHAENPAVLEFGPLSLDIESRALRHKGRKLSLKGRQFDILAAMMRRPEVVVTREQLITALDELELSDRTIDSHVSQLRKKLKDQGVTAIEIQPVYGVGYRLE